MGIYSEYVIEYVCIFCVLLSFYNGKEERMGYKSDCMVSMVYLLSIRWDHEENFVALQFQGSIFSVRLRMTTSRPAAAHVDLCFRSF